MFYKRLKKQLNEQFAVNAALMRENMELKQELASKQEELARKQITLDAEMKFSDQAQDEITKLRAQIERKEGVIKKLYKERKADKPQKPSNKQQPKKQPKEDVDPYPEE